MPLGLASHCISKSSHAVCDLRALSAVLYSAQFVVQTFLRIFLLSVVRSDGQLRMADPCN